MLLTLIKLLFQNKKRSGTSLSASFCLLLLKKNIYHVIFYWLTIFHCLVAFPLWDIWQYMYCNSFLTRLWRHKILNYPYISNRAVFSTLLKSQDKHLNILRTKRAFKMQKKHWSWNWICMSVSFCWLWILLNFSRTRSNYCWLRILEREWW